jgi:hypothetical protein
MRWFATHDAAELGGRCARLEHLVPNPLPKVCGLWFDVDIAALRQGEMERGQTRLVKAQPQALIMAVERKSAIGQRGLT